MSKVTFALIFTDRVIKWIDIAQIYPSLCIKCSLSQNISIQQVALIKSSVIKSRSKNAASRNAKIIMFHGIDTYTSRDYIFSRSFIPLPERFLNYYRVSKLKLYELYINATFKGWKKARIFLPDNAYWVNSPIYMSQILSTILKSMHQGFIIYTQLPPYFKCDAIPTVNNNLRVYQLRNHCFLPWQLQTDRIDKFHLSVETQQIEKHAKMFFLKKLMK